MKSLTEPDEMSRPRPMTTSCSAVRAISLMRWLETKTVRPSRGEALEQVAHPQDALGVEPVDGLVEEQDWRVTEERRGDAEALAHAEGELADAPVGDRGESDHLEHLVDARRGMSLVWAKYQQVVEGAAARVDGLGLEQRAHFAQRADPGRGRRSPLIVAVPASGASRPMIIRIVVDLPEPLGPRNPVTTPSRTSKDRSSTADVVLVPLGDCPDLNHASSSEAALS